MWSSTILQVGEDTQNRIAEEVTIKVNYVLHGTWFQCVTINSRCIWLLKLSLSERVRKGRGCSSGGACAGHPKGPMTTQSLASPVAKESAGRTG